jgi:hypothetical protein
MPDREELLRWALEKPQPPATFDIDVFKRRDDKPAKAVSAQEDS